MENEAAPQFFSSWMKGYWLSGSVCALGGDRAHQRFDDCQIFSCTKECFLRMAKFGYSMMEHKYKSL
ncbi:hypothetical protein DP113_12955 [Brasilonema octagenarum UFV-E1]|uniref:Uncharacterized protein n=1 Tax=Brasilonema sennae CENA114 TaxID=415709 RepID=A0A856MDA6_9CYAN|nr:hypothetical protein [Brasilonema sennae]QDL08688.1 hypothetical protein DP114_13015 [Brasilonema sennae CENA114]QDL15044.1 hypothetical protein DP113_12955 [Brasilonema octagenarum UFV-E1]